ncbi:hypothetical protein, partial [Sandarakinorhabdus sp.]|uniref:hypothetical protein n=1 Tax=Sandarakinorhabdus sp. TaxID=1916663 RepID=UPI003566FC04
MLDDAATDLEVRHHLKRIDDRGHAPAGRLDEVADLRNERGERVGLGFRGGRGGNLFGGGFLFHRDRASMSWAFN